MAPMPGTVRNMNGSGLGLETWEPLPVGSDLCLTVGQVSLQARLLCRVVWCHLVRTELTNSGSVIPIYRSGVRFLEIGERVREPT